MAPKFRSIDAAFASKGQLRLAFFFAGLIIAGYARSEVVFSASSQQLASSGVLTEKHWLNDSLKQSSPTEWIQIKNYFEVTKQTGSLTWGLAKSRLGYLYSNRNTLHLAAQDKANDRVDLSPQGSFSLRARTQMLSSTVVSVNWSHRLREDVLIKFKPHIHLIHDYQRSEGSLALRTQGRQSRLTGPLTRVGTRNYGFLRHDEPDSGWGWGLDTNLVFNSPWGVTQFDAANLLSQLCFNSVHYSDRKYDVVTENGNDVLVSDLPSIQGRYGVTTRSEKLPVAWRLTFKPDYVEGFNTGLTALGSDARWTAGYTQKIGLHRLWVQTVEAANWTVGWDANFSARWMAGISVTGTRTSDPVFSGVYLRAVW